MGVSNYHWLGLGHELVWVRATMYGEEPLARSHVPVVIDHRLNPSRVSLPLSTQQPPPTPPPSEFIVSQTFPRRERVAKSIALS